MCVCWQHYRLLQPKEERTRKKREKMREKEISSAIQNQFHLNQRINDSQKLDSLKYAHTDTIRARFRLKINAFAFVQSYEKKKFSQTKRFAHVDWHTKQLIAVFFIYIQFVHVFRLTHCLSLSYWSSTCFVIELLIVRFDIDINVSHNVITATSNISGSSSGSNNNTSETIS